MLNFYEAKAANQRKSFVVVVLFALFVAAVVYVLAKAWGVYNGYQTGSLGFVGLALIISGISSFVGYYFSDRIVLGISGARPADRKRDFDFYTVSENLCLGAGLPKPRLYVINDSAPNAFATGRDPEHAVVCATSGLLSKLSRSELEGVIAHELTHIRSYDIRLSSLVAVMVGLIALLGDWFLRSAFWGRSNRDENKSGGIFIILGLIFAILSPIVAQLIQLAISRQREYSADAGSVEITRQPDGLISALEKISADQEPLEAANRATAHMYIVSPFREKSPNNWFAGLFNTHPPVSDRIKILKSML